jgi:hypothetical protein
VRVFFDLPIELCSCRQGTGSGLPLAQAAGLRWRAAGAWMGTYDWTQLTDQTRMPRARATTADRLRASLDRLAVLAEGS